MKMNIPGFTAELSWGKTIYRYVSGRVALPSLSDASVVPALPKCSAQVIRQLQADIDFWWNHWAQWGDWAQEALDEHDLDAYTLYFDNETMAQRQAEAAEDRLAACV